MPDTDTRSPDDRTRLSDEGWLRRLGHRRPRILRENWYRDVWMLCLSALLVWVALSADQTQTQTNTLVGDVQDGRRVSLRVVCAVNGAVIDAGRAIITGSSGGPPKGARARRFERNLRRLGYPPRADRKAAAEAAAREYGRRIARAVERQSGVKGIVRDDGTVDCRRLAVASNVE